MPLEIHFSSLDTSNVLRSAIDEISWIYWSTRSSNVSAKTPLTLPQIASLLAADENLKQVFLIIDETPISSESSALGETVIKLLTDLIYLLRHGNASSNPRILVASLFDPLTIDVRLPAKFNEQFKVFHAQLWTSKELNGLLELIEKRLPHLRLNGNERSLIIDTANGRPRNLKIILRAILFEMGHDQINIQAIIEKLKPQFFH
jgi:hypothetical protein